MKRDSFGGGVPENAAGESGTHVFQQSESRSSISWNAESMRFRDAAAVAGPLGTLKKVGKAVLR